MNRDFFIIYSGNAMYKLLKSSQGSTRLYADPFKDRHSADEKLPYWQGTIVGVDISLNATKEFSILLDLIRDIYIKTVKERKKARYRRPRFV